MVKAGETSPYVKEIEQVGRRRGGRGDGRKTGARETRGKCVRRQGVTETRAPAREKGGAMGEGIEDWGLRGPGEMGS